MNLQIEFVETFSCSKLFDRLGGPGHDQILRRFAGKPGAAPGPTDVMTIFCFFFEWKEPQKLKFLNVVLNKTTNNKRTG